MANSVCNKIRMVYRPKTLPTQCMNKGLFSVWKFLLAGLPRDGEVHYILDSSHVIGDHIAVRKFIHRWGTEASARFVLELVL